jgi:TolA-binding protein
MQAAEQHGSGREGPQEPLRRRISNFLARAVSRFRIALWVVVIAAAAFLLGYIIYGQIQGSRSTQSAQLVETAQETFSSWQSETDATKKAALEKTLLDQLATAISRYSGQYGAQRGLFIRAELHFTNKAWDSAIADYQALAARFPKSYLAPISLFNAAICYEEKGDVDKAQKLYVQVYESFPSATVAPRAIFDAARLDESKSLWSAAQAKYQSLDTLYSQSVWDRIAKNRLIELKVLGKIQ